MKLLALDTATDACTCALVLDGDTLVRHEVAPRRHAEIALAMVESMLDESGVALDALDAIAFGRGPGSFTGVRIATGLVQGLAYGAGLPVVGVSTLRAVAQGVAEEGGEQVLVAFDARMNEVYCGAFRRDGSGLMQPAGEERVCPPGNVTVPGPGSWTVLGEGWRAYESELRDALGDAVGRTDPDRLPHARDLARLALDALARGETCAPADAIPVYLRDRVADPRAERATPDGL